MDRLFDIYSKIKKKLINLVNFRARTLLHIACYRGNVLTVKYLLERYRETNESLDQRDKNGDTPLNLACIRGYDGDEDETWTTQPDSEDLEKNTGNEENKESSETAGKPYTTSARYEIVRLLLRQGANLKRRDNLNSPLHWAIYWADLHLASILYEFYPNQVIWTNAEGQIPFDICLLCPRSKIKGFQGTLIVEDLLDDIMNDMNEMIQAAKNKTSKEEINRAYKSKFSFVFKYDIRQAIKKFFEIPKIYNEALDREEVFKTHNITGDWDKRRQKVQYAECFYVDIQAERELETSHPMDLIKKFAKKSAIVRLNQVSKENKKKWKNFDFEKAKNDVIFIIDHTKKLKAKGNPKLRITKNLQKLFHWLAYFERADEMLLLMKEFRVSPFVKNKLGRNILHQLCRDNKHQMLNFVLNCCNYRFSGGSGTTLDDALQMQSDFDFSTCTHYCFQYEAFESYQILKKKMQEIELKKKKKIPQENGPLDLEIPISLPIGNTPKQQSEQEKKENEAEAVILALDKILEKVNFRGRQAIDLSNGSKKFAAEKKRYQNQCIKNILRLTNVDQLKSNSKQILGFNTEYQYAIIAYDDCPNENGDIPWEKRARNTTVYKQLDNIAQNPAFALDEEILKESADEKGEYDPNFKIKIIEGYTNNAKLSDNYFIYLIKVHPQLSNRLADDMDIQAYDFKNRFHTAFMSDSYKNFEPLRDIFIQQIIIYMLMSEFDLDSFTKEGLIIEHFPTHRFKERVLINKYWRKYYFSTIIDPIKPGLGITGTIPLTQIAFYHGIQHGFYISFVINYTSWLLLASVPGLCFTLYSAIWSPTGYDHRYLSLLAIFIALWVSVMIEGWKRRRNSLAFIWDMYGVQKGETKRFQYHVKIFIYK